MGIRKRGVGERGGNQKRHGRKREGGREGGREGRRDGRKYLVGLDALQDLILAGRGGGEKIVKRASGTIKLADTLAEGEGGQERGRV